MYESTTTTTNCNGSIVHGTDERSGSHKSKDGSASSPLRHIAVVSPPNCNDIGIDDNYHHHHHHPNSHEGNAIDGNNTDQPESSTIPSTRTSIVECGTALVTVATTTTPTPHRNNITSAFVPYTLGDQMDDDPTTTTGIIPTSPITTIHNPNQSMGRENPCNGCFLDTNNNFKNSDGDEIVVDDDNEKYTDLLCMEEILSLSDSNHSHRSFITNTSVPGDDNDDGETIHTWYDSGSTIVRFFGMNEFDV
jgi:hypothetical protein